MYPKLSIIAESVLRRTSSIAVQIAYHTTAVATTATTVATHKPNAGALEAVGPLRNGDGTSDGILEGTYDGRADGMYDGSIELAAETAIGA